MTDKPSEAALRKACEVLGWRTPCDSPLGMHTVLNRLARHFDAEDKAAREAFARCIPGGSSAPFIARHILPDPKPTVDSVLDKWAMMPESNANDLVQMLRDAGLLRE